MSKHTTYTFEVVRHVPGSENHQIDYISGTGQRRINILVSTHNLMCCEESNTFLCGMRNPIHSDLLMWGEESNKHICNGL